MTDVVLFRELESVLDKKVAIATLNSERSLNALSLQMVELLLPKLKEWQADPEVALVVLEGVGDKAFCAVGDIVDLYKASIVAGKGNIAPEVTEFFSKEYRLDYLIHRFEKPILVWGHGIVMGGGLGLMAGASHRVVTEKSRIAMPEVAIGLYPDVGGTYFLNKMPPGCGLFLGLTGASINATDAKYIHLADHFISSSRKVELIEKLLLVHWGDTVALNHQKLTDVLTEFEVQDQVHMPAGNIAKHQDLIEQLVNCDRVESAVVKILDQVTTDKWLSKAQQGLANGSALSMHIVKHQLKVGAEMTLAECFRMEIGLSVKCAALGEFVEGVRALLIDKDNQPAWLFDSVHDVDQSVLKNLFSDVWEANEHPLSQLELMS
jgi:enoyl-CoA hydratase/carnithine racemase